LYKRFINPNADDKKLIKVSRLSVIALAIVAVFVAAQINSIEKAWKFLIAIAAGAGMPQMLRWFWHRANAYTEIAGMSTSLVLSISLYLTLDTMKDEHMLVIIAFSSVAVSVVCTLLTAPVAKEKLDQFVYKVKPFGYWPGHDRLEGHKTYILMYILATLSILTAMFSIGCLVLLNFGLAIILGCVFVLSTLGLLRLINQIDEAD